MATRTQNDLVRMVLTDVLGRYSESDPIPADDSKSVKKIYADVLEILRDDGLAYWDLSAIPGVAVRHVVDIVAYRAAPGYGVPLTSLTEVTSGITLTLEQRGMRGLRKHLQKTSAKEPVRANYF